MKNIDLMIERAFLDDGSIVVGPAVHVRNLTEDQLDELIRLALRLKLDPESKELLTRTRQELRECVDWFISIDQKYGVLRHIEHGEWPEYRDELEDLNVGYPDFNLNVSQSIEYYRLAIARNPSLRLRVSKQNCVTVEKLVQRVNMRATKFRSLPTVEWEIKRYLTDIHHAPVVALILAYLMESISDEHGRHTYQLIENRLKWILEKDRERLLEYPDDFDELFDLRGITFKELKRRRARARKLLDKFLNTFPEDFAQPLFVSQLFPAVRVSFDQAVQDFCQRLTDDELLEFLCAYGGYTNGRWDARSKNIAMAAETRMRRQFE